MDSFLAPPERGADRQRALAARGYGGASPRPIVITGQAAGRKILDSTLWDNRSRATGAHAGFPDRLAHIIGRESVRSFARRAGVSDTFVRQCLSGRTEPTRTKLVALATTGNVSVEWLATGEAAVARTTSDTLEAIAATVEAVVERHAPELDPTGRARLIRRMFDAVQGGDHCDARSPDYAFMLLQGLSGETGSTTPDTRPHAGGKQNTYQENTPGDFSRR